MRWRVGRLVSALTVVAAASLALTACGGSSGAPARPSGSPAAAATSFDDQGAGPISCMQHQRRQPTPAYQTKTASSSEALLRVLGYYTANGNKAYCDGKPPTAIDRQWLQLYVNSGAEPKNVQRQGVTGASTPAPITG